MQTHDHSADVGHAGHTHQAAGLLRWVLPGAALLLNAWLADALYPDNPLLGDLSAAAGALLLALPIFRTALRDLIHGHAHFDGLVALAVLAAMSQGDFRTGGVIAFFMLVSMVVETRTAEGAHAAIEKLVRLTPQRARRLRADAAGAFTEEPEVPAAELRVGDRLRVLPGETIPADGRILRGQAALNEASITGESLPVDKGPGAEVFAGSLNLTGALEIEVARAGADTTLGRVRELILAAEKTRLPLSRLMDRHAGYYIPIVLTLAAFVWFFTGDWDRVVAMLVVACPCAIILATPSAMVAALSAAARHGILIKDVADLEAVARVNAVVFDKTGTLTTGELGVTRLQPAAGVRPAELLAAAAGAEKFSRHPAARALLRLAAESALALSDPEDFHEEAGQGVRARVDGAEVTVGRASWLAARGVAASDAPAADEQSVLHVARAGQYLGWMALCDQPRAEASGCLAELRGLGLRRLAMLTGDRRAVAERVARELGCDEVRAECLPAQKLDFVRAVRAAGHRVLVVGDGVNDAPALAAGDISMAMGAAGSEVAIHSATIALMNNDLRRIPLLIRLSRTTRATVYQNLLAGLVFIVGGLYLSGAGWLSPIVAVLLHNAGSLLVVFNSARLIRFGETEFS